ncbi:MAG TPA: MaoC family dehydratase [Afipia sp.]
MRQRQGNYFEDFRIGQVIRHSTPRTLTDGDSSVYIALTGTRYAASSADTAARKLGYPGRPVDDLLVFNIAFGKTVADISLNAIANLGYAELRFLAPVFVGDTLRCESAVIGLKESSNRKSGVVYVRSTCYDKDDRAVLSWVRWVLVHKRDPSVEIKESFVPELANTFSADQLFPHAHLRSHEALEGWCEATGSDELWDDYEVGERIDHTSGVTIEEADHMSAARLYQNNARPHFDGLAMRESDVGRRLVYGGHIISVCRALAYDGLENVLGILAVNAGTHVAPTVAGDTLYACSEVLEKWKLPGRTDVAALRLRMIGLKNAIPSEIHKPRNQTAARPTYHPAVVLDLDYTVLMPRRQSRDE